MIKAIFEPFGYWRDMWRNILRALDFILSGEALSQLRVAWICFEVLSLAVGLLFWASLWFGISALSPETYGRWACELPALVWASAQIIGSAMIIYGLMRPVTHHHAMIGALVHVVQYQALALSALLSGGQAAIGIYPSVMFVPMHIVLAVEVWRHGRQH